MNEEKAFENNKIEKIKNVEEIKISDSLRKELDRQKEEAIKVIDSLIFNKEYCQLFIRDGVIDNLFKEITFETKNGIFIDMNKEYIEISISYISKEKDKKEVDYKQGLVLNNDYEKNINQIIDFTQNLLANSENKIEKGFYNGVLYLWQEIKHEILKQINENNVKKLLDENSKKDIYFAKVEEKEFDLSYF